MVLRKYRWSRDYESAEEELIELLELSALDAERWTLPEFEAVTASTPDYNTEIWCAEGSITYRIDGRSFSVQPGDALQIPAGMAREATAGISGCACYEYRS